MPGLHEGEPVPVARSSVVEHVGRPRGNITFEADALEKARADGFMVAAFSRDAVGRVSGTSRRDPFNAWRAECERTARRVVMVCALVSERYIVILFEPGDEESEAAERNRLREAFHRLVGEQPRVDTEDDVEVWVSTPAAPNAALALARELAHGDARPARVGASTRRSRGPREPGLRSRAGRGL